MGTNPTNVLWKSTNPRVKRWYDKVASKSKNTAVSYLNGLFQYWGASLSKRFDSVEAWISQVRADQDSKDLEIEQRWATQTEEYYLTAFKGIPSRRITAAAVKSFLSQNVRIPDYQFTLASQEELAADAKQKRDAPLMTWEEIRTLYTECRTRRDRAMILTVGTTGLGETEFLQFNKDWHEIESAIRAKTAPTRFNVVRRKKTVPFYSIFFEDTMDALADLLEERERLGGKVEGELFVTEDGKPLTAARIQEFVRDLRDRAKLGKHVKLHEFRDTFSTLCSNKHVDPKVVDFLLGHITDPLLYNKWDRTEEGRAYVLSELDKVRPFLNLLTGRGKPPDKDDYFQRTVETIALTKGLDPEEVKKQLLYYASKLEAVKNHRLQGRTGHVPIEVVVRHLSPEELRPAVISFVKSISIPTPTHAVDQVIDEEELSKYLAEGWVFVSVVNSRKVVVRRQT